MVTMFLLKLIAIHFIFGAVMGGLCILPLPYEMILLNTKIRTETEIDEKIADMLLSRPGVFIICMFIGFGFFIPFFKAAKGGRK